MQVQMWTVEQGASRASAATWDLDRKGVIAEQTEVDGRHGVVVLVSAEQEDQVAKVFQLWEGELAQVEEVVPDGVVEGLLRRRRSSGAVDRPFDHEQVGVRVVLEDGAVVDVPQGIGYEVRHTENLHVLRGSRRVAVFRAGSWRYAERVFGDRLEPVVDG